MTQNKNYFPPFQNRPDPLPNVTILNWLPEVPLNNPRVRLLESSVTLPTTQPVKALACNVFFCCSNS